MLATLAVVFVVGFRVPTSGARKAIRRLSDRLNIDGQYPWSRWSIKWESQPVTNFTLFASSG